MNATDTAQRIERILRDRFEPVHFELVDESHLHVGHAGAASGGGHFRVLIVSSAFQGRGLLDQHRLVNDELAGMIGNEIHALSIRTLTPDQWQAG
jgi:BolA protein